MLFSLTPAGWRWRKILSTLHDFTKKVIAERKAEYASSETKTDVDDVGMKKRLAFLDLLIEASEVDLNSQGRKITFLIFSIERDCPD